MRGAWFVWLAFASRLALAANVGAGFGESQLALVSARQAGTGGIALEDPWRQGSLVETATMLYVPGPRWVGLAGQGGVGPWLRVGFEGSLVEGPSAPRTLEYADGSLQETSGSAQTPRQTGGFGVRWKSGAGPALQLDYAVAPLGALGLTHDATVGVRW